MSDQIGVSAAHGSDASKVHDFPEDSIVNRYDFAPFTLLKSNAGAQMNCRDCSFQNGAFPGAPGRIGISDSRIASSANGLAAIDAAWEKSAKMSAGNLIRSGRSKTAPRR